MLAVLLGGLSMVSPFSIDTFFPAFHAMEKGLQVNAAQLQQVIERIVGWHGGVGARALSLERTPA